MNKKRYFSVVVPVFNSEKSLEELYSRLQDVFKKMRRTFEVIFVNDGSHDKSLNVLRKIKSENENVIVIDLFKNFGQQNALMCGFQYCKGEYVITIDDDLQNPPEEIGKLYDKIEEGYDAVFAAYKKKKDKLYKNIGSLFIRKVNQKIFKLKNSLRFSSFRIIKREIVEELNKIKTPYPYVSGMILSISMNLTNAEVKHSKRTFGKSNYSVRKLIKLSFNLLINYSTIPLKAISFLGLIVSFFSFVIGLSVLIRKLIVGSTRAGWTSTIVLISFFASIFFMISFIFGEYLGRMLGEIAKDKQYSIRKIYK
ncbi:MAG: glycosyltransferase family 2 protein [Candidatus Aminicenantes bacterium]|nr:glycosyltransferase family 2 protein [Candidatus Aminicenantes bacterium]